MCLMVFRARDRFASGGRCTSTCCRRATPAARPGRTSRPGWRTPPRAIPSRRGVKLTANNPFPATHDPLDRPPRRRPDRRRHHPGPRRPNRPAPDDDAMTTAEDRITALEAAVEALVDQLQNAPALAAAPSPPAPPPPERWAAPADTADWTELMDWVDGLTADYSLFANIRSCRAGRRTRRGRGTGRAPAGLGGRHRHRHRHRGWLATGP